MRSAALIVLVSVGCKGEPKVQPEATRDDGAVRLPRSAATPVTKLCAATPEMIARLAAITHVDFERADLGTTATVLQVRHTTKARPRLGVTIELAACAGDCPDNGDAMPDSLQGLPGTRDERGTLDDARFALGRPIRTRYQIGSTEKGLRGSADDGGRRTYLDAYALYADDGATRLRVTASYLDDAVGGVDRLVAIAPPEDLQKLATAFASFYLHECQ